MVAVNSKLAPQGQHIVLDGISWTAYESLRHDLQERQIRLTYNDGELEILYPQFRDEVWKCRIGRMIDIVSLDREIEFIALGSTTFAREDLAKGAEPDECYYVAHAADVEGKDELDLTVDPPPDLAVEVDITSRSIPRQPIYAALGVPELWRFDGTQLQVLKLGEDRAYAPVTHSSVFPFLDMSRFETFLLRMGRERQLAVLEEFRIWLRSL